MRNPSELILTEPGSPAERRTRITLRRGVFVITFTSDYGDTEVVGFLPIDTLINALPKLWGVLPSMRRVNGLVSAIRRIQKSNRLSWKGNLEEVNPAIIKLLSAPHRQHLIEIMKNKPIEINGEDLKIFFTPFSSIAWIHILIRKDNWMTICLDPRKLLRALESLRFLRP